MQFDRADCFEYVMVLIWLVLVGWCWWLVGGWLVVGYLVKTRSPLKRSSTLKAIDLLKQFITSVWETKFSVTVAPVWVV